MDAAVAALLIPPRPPVAEHELKLLPFLRAVRRNALTMWTERAYHEWILVHRFLSRRNVLVNDPDAIHHVLVDNAANYRRSPASIRILRPITGNGLLLSEGEAWRHQRRTIAPALAPRVLPILARHIVTTATEQIVSLVARMDQPVELLPAMQSLALEIAGRSMVSLEMHQYGPAMRRMLTEYGAHLARPHLFDLLLPASVPTLRDLRRARFRARWMRLIESIMQTRLEVPAPEHPRDLFDLLRSARDPETGQGFAPAQLRDQLATLILAGHETTAVTLFWALSLLAQDPGEQARVAAEVADVPIAPDDAMAAMPRLVRTRAVVNETLRLYPPAFTLVREAIGPDQLGSLFLPRGSIVMMAPWVLHRHRRLWRDPDAFDPSRFLPDAPPVPRFAYLPFGAGPRVCVGAQFALTEATLVLAMLLRRFRVTLLDPPPVPAAVVTTQPDRPVRFRLQAR
jgi:unspecific monooxygenase